ncbi:MAG: ATP-binding cassette domain-containing protein [Bacteroidota bacterium]
MKVLETNRLSKSYGKIKAVTGLDLTVEPGQVYGILGPNGSGKTTTLGMIMGIIHQDDGGFSWFEEGSGSRLRKRIGTLLETPNFYPYLSAVKNLKIVAHIKKDRTSDIGELLQLVNLYDRKDSAFKTYSLGMKQRLAIAAALIGDPDVLIFDEPTNGLDPEGIKEVRELLLKIAQRGKTIIMASHILDEVEKVCTHVAIIKKGKLLATGSVGAIINAKPTVEIAAKDLKSLEAAVTAHAEVDSVTVDNGKIILTLSENYSTGDLNKWAYDNGYLLTHLVERQKSLEEEFLEITRSENN